MKLRRVIEDATIKIKDELVDSLAYACIHFKVCLFKHCKDCPHYKVERLTYPI